jgi:para-nitrobenzyl esterase
MIKTSVIDSKCGKIQGYNENGVEIFKGIPFAEPPIGDLRFSPPVKKKPWDGILDATKYGPCAYQGFTRLEEWFEKLEPESEDCLNLNIWTPATDNEKRPVMFWIHGGAFMMGSGISPIYEGSALAKRGNVVVVTINYRLILNILVETLIMSQSLVNPQEVLLLSHYRLCQQQMDSSKKLLLKVPHKLARK